jgi:hypothetical protein
MCPGINSNRLSTGYRRGFKRGERVMKEESYIQYLVGAAIIGVLLYMVPSYGVLLLVSTLIVLAFALVVALLGGGMYICEQSLKEFRSSAEESRPVNIRNAAPGR